MLCVLFPAPSALTSPDLFAPGRVRPGDVLLCLTNKKRHPVTAATSIEYIKKKIMGAPRTVCRLTLQRDGLQFDVDLRSPR